MSAAERVPTFDELAPLEDDESSEAPEFHSAEPDGTVGSNQLLPFRTARETAAMAPEAITWLLDGYIPATGLIELVGAAKRAGKSTLVAHVVAAILDGKPILGRATTRTPVVWLTEQSSSSLRELLVRAGLEDRDDLVVLQWHEARAASWETIVAAAEAECERIGARLLVVDTISQWAGIRGDAENAAGSAGEAMEPLKAAADGGLAVMAVRHERKGGGAVGESGRGSSAFTGSVDVVLRLARQEAPVRPGVRVLSALSRFDATPDELVIELTDDGDYIALGDAAAVAFVEARDAVLDVLPEDDGSTLSEVLERVGGRRTTVQSALVSLIDDGRVEKVGSGRRGDPFRYRRVDRSDPAIMFLPPPREGAAAETNRRVSAGPDSPVLGLVEPPEVAEAFPGGMVPAEDRGWWSES